MAFPLAGRAACAPRFTSTPHSPLMSRPIATLLLLVALAYALCLLVDARRDSQQNISPDPSPTPAPTPKVIFRTPDETRVRSLEIISI